MAWEEDEYVLNVPPRERPWQGNVSALATTSKNGLLPQLPKNVQSHILTALSGKKVKHYSNTPQKMLRHNKFKRNIAQGANAMTRRRVQRERNAERNEWIAQQAAQEAAQRAANNAARQAREAQQAQLNFAERLRIGTTMPSEAERQANKNRLANQARTRSRIRRGMSNWVARMPKRTRRRKGRKN